MLISDLICNKIKIKQLLEINGKPVRILNIRNIIDNPIKESTYRKAPNISRSTYLLTVQDYFTNVIYSIYNNSVTNYKNIGFFGKIKLRFKKVFGG